jgi:hypothetical protein
MAEAPAYQSGLIAALRGGGNASGVSVPGMTMMPNAPARQGSPMSFGGTSSFGNLMTPPSFAPAQGALPMQPPPMAGMPQSSQPMPSFQPPPMTGNLMPAPQFAPAQDYIAPPRAAPTPPPGTIGPGGSYVDQYGRWRTPADDDNGYDQRGSGLGGD